MSSVMVVAELRTDLNMVWGVWMKIRIPLQWRGGGVICGEMQEITAIVPIKRNSERIPGKNFVDLGGKPLYRHVLETLREVEAVSCILVDTDCRDALGELEGMEKVVLLERPKRLHGDAVVMNELLEAILEGREEEHFLQTHVTNPLLTAATIEACIASYFAHLDSHDSLFTVQRIQKRVYDAAGKAINHDLEVMQMTQDLPPVFVENSNLFLFSRSSYYNNGKNRLGKRPLLHEMDALEGLDIDEPADLELARVLISQMAQNRR